MENDNRSAKRTGMNVKIKLKAVQTDVATAGSEEDMEVEVVNISKNGIGFKTEKLLTFNGLYDTEIILSNGERFNSVINISCSFLPINT